MSPSTSTLDLPNPSSDSPASPKITSPTPNGAQLSPTETVDPEAQISQQDPSLPSKSRKILLLAVFCLAQFLDVFGASAVIVGLSQMAKDLDMTVAESTWIVNAYSLTLAATLLTGGRVADITNAKVVFIVGFLLLAVFSLGVGLSNNKTTLLVLRAFSGLGAAMTIPAAVHLIVHLFPEPKEQANALAAFGGAGAIANVLGLIVGGALLLGGWSWIFYFSTIIATPLSILCIFVIPNPHTLPHEDTPAFVLKNGVEIAADRKPKMDYLGTFLQTAAIVLLIYGLTEANVKGWREPATISTIIIGFLLFPAFFFWESKISPIDALVAPSMWRIPNFTLLIVYGLPISYWFFETQVSFSNIFQGVWGLSGINTAVRFLPCGIFTTLMVAVSQGIPVAKFPLKLRLIIGPLVAGGATIPFSFVDDKSDYWRLCFPGFIVGSVGAALGFVSAYISMLTSVPPRHSGVAGGIWSSIVQLGAAALLSITVTVQVAFPDHPGDVAPSRRGYQNGYYFCIGMMVLDAILILIFYKEPVVAQAESGSNDASAKVEAEGKEEQKEEEATRKQ